MLSLVLSRVAHAYADDVPILEDVNLHLAPGWTGVVGANGAGKTTLLRLLAGEIEPAAGEIRRTPHDLAAVLCPQTVEERTRAIDAFADAEEARARGWLGRLALDPAALERWPTLSPGERKRWQLGAALAAEPDLLLLDEPTNHVDAEARALLVGALARFRGIGLVVSHDRALLDELTTSTVRVHRTRARLWTGGHAAARHDWEAADRAEQERWSKLRAEQAKLAERMSDRRAEHARAESRMRTSKRMKSPRDSDARGRFKATRRRSAERSLAREVEKVHARLDRVGEELAAFRFEKARGRSLFVDFVPSPAPRLLELREPVVCAGCTPVLRGVDVRVDRASRVRVAGPNGAGKTTLLGALVERARIPRERLLWLPQELDSAEAQALLDSLRALRDAERGRVLAFVAALGVDPDRLLRSRAPSPGEARKTALAFGLGRQVWALVLDEPTNHLDLPSIERLEDCLETYPGALVVVTHDDAFARACTRETWTLCDGRVRIGAA
jgi:ATPase subunit of ABC transporter with duplicated ATPase domains